MLEQEFLGGSRSTSTWGPGEDHRTTTLKQYFLTRAEVDLDLFKDPVGTRRTTMLSDLEC